MIWLFTVLDILVLFTITLTHFNIAFSYTLLILSISYLSIKGFMFFGEIMSFIDIGIAFYILLLLFGLKVTFLYYVALSWFIYKLLITLID